jgi:uncharacterized repeat protein (TIGR02543 family)
MKTLKKALVALLGAVLGCCFFVGCLSTKLSVTYVVDGETYRVQEYEMDTQIALPKDPTKEGYTFIGWYTDEALTVPYAESTVTAGLTLYAKFSVSTVYIVVNTAGGDKIDAIEVVPGGDYTVPEATKAGHTFLGYTYIDENGDEQDFPLTGKFPSNVGIKITAKYAANKYTVTFVGYGTSEQEVAYGSVAIAPNADKPGYNFDGWYTSETEQTDATKFDMTTAITDNITLYAKYSAKTFTITVNGAQAGYENPSVVYGETYTLLAPSRENREFVGFTMNGEDFPATGTYTWTTDIAVTAVWDGVGKDVMFFDGDKEMTAIRIDTETGVDMATLRLPPVPTKDGYSTDGKWYTDAACTTEFVANGTVETDIRLYAKYTANEYTVTFVVWDKANKTTKTVDVKVTYGETFTAPAKAERDAYNFDGYFYSESLFDVNAPYAYAMNITVMEKWTLKDDASLFVDYDSTKMQFLERKDYDDEWTFVYLVGAYYEWKNTEVTFVSADGEQYATVEGNKLTINAAGEFVIQLKNDAGIRQQAIKAINPIRSFATGGDFDTAWGLNDNGTDYKRNSTDVWQKKVTLAADEAMKVGATNFKPEVEIDGYTTTFDAASVNVSVVVDGAETNAYTVANGAINFNASLVGKKATVTLTPKYNIGGYKAVYYVEINNATNVYTNEEMKAAFANTSVTEINVLRDIKAALSEDQMDTFVWEGKTYTAPLPCIDKNGNYVGGMGAYNRVSGNLKVNGNYFTIDGSGLPLVDGRLTDYYGGRVGHSIQREYVLQDAYLSVFNFGQHKVENRDTFTLDNLNIIGNAKMDATATTGYLIDNKPVLMYSGACIGIQVGGGTLNANNITSRLGAFGMNGYAYLTLGDSPAVTLNATDCKFENNWSNNIYCAGVMSINLTRCYIGAANGAAIHLDAWPFAANVDNSLTMVDTKIENWVVGNEAWFKAFDVTAAVPTIQVSVNTAVQYATNGTKTVLNKDNKINFAILMKGVGDNSEWVTDNVGIATLGFSSGTPTFDVVKFAQDQSNYMDAWTGQYAKFASADLGFYMEGYVEIINA